MNGGAIAYAIVVTVMEWPHSISGAGAFPLRSHFRLRKYQGSLLTASQWEGKLAFVEGVLASALDNVQPKNDRLMECTGELAHRLPVGGKACFRGGRLALVFVDGVQLKISCLQERNR